MSDATGKPGRFDGPVGLGVVLLAVIAGAALVERLTRPTSGGQATSPVPLPELMVQGWLNTDGGPGPTKESLLGRYVVADFWATDCLPCLRSLPSLSRFYDRWRDRGVEVVGLTAERPSKIEAIEAAIARVDGMEWPVAYGAGMIHSKMNVSMIPTYILFDPEGRSVWRGHSINDLEDELSSRM